MSRPAADKRAFRFLRRLGWKAVVGIAGILILILFAIVMPQISYYGPDSMPAVNMPPNLGNNRLFLRVERGGELQLKRAVLAVRDRTWDKQPVPFTVAEDVDLHPGELVSFPFTVVHTGNEGNVRLELAEPVAAPVSVTYRLNLPPVDAGPDSWVNWSPPTQGTVSFAAGESVAEASLRPAVFYPEAGNRPVEGRLKVLLLLGSDSIGRDLGARIAAALPPTLLMAVGAMLIALTIALTLALLAGIHGGVADLLITWVGSGFRAVPQLFVIILIASIWNFDSYAIFIAIGMTSWMVPAHAMGSKVKTLMVEDFVLAARSVGLSRLKIVLLHVWPHLLPMLLVFVAHGIGYAVVLESAISFIGWEAQAGTPVLGDILATGFDQLKTIAGTTHNLWQILFPGFTIMLIVFSFNYLGDGLRALMRGRA